MKNIKFWLKKNWWKILIPIVLIPTFIFWLYIRKINKIKQLYEFAEKP